MTYKYLFGRCFYVVLAACIAIALVSSQASACPSWYTATYQNAKYVYSTGTMCGADPGFGLHVNLALSGPGGGFDSDDTGNNFSFYCVDTNVQLTIGIKDGTYITTGTYHHVFPPDTRSLMAQEVKQEYVPPFVQLVTTTQSSATISKINGTARFEGRLLTSINCAGRVSLVGAMTYPTGMQIQIASAPPGIFQNNSVANVDTLGAGQTQNRKFILKTLSSNTTTGTVTAQAYISSWPGFCVTKGPESGSGNTTTKSYSVN